MHFCIFLADFLSFFFLSNLRATSAQGMLIDGHKILKCFKIFAYIKKKYYLCTGKQNNSFH